jgi:hypothetical protein
LFTKGRRDASQSLLEAQAKLIELRELVRRSGGEGSPPAAAHGRSLTSSHTPTGETNPLPEHIGWGSEPLTRILRASLPARQTSEDGHEGSGARNPSPSPHHKPPTSDPAEDHDLSTRLIKLYPDIALALLRQQLVSPGRLWLLLRYIDHSGRGWIDVDRARRRLAAKGSSLRLVGWRQMRKLLARGEGLFWQQTGRRIWLRSPLKVAASLGISHLNYRPVGLPLAELLQNIGQVRAHFYASFHSGRSPEKKGVERPTPIARATLQALCQTSRRTLRAYERRAGVQTQRNFAVGKPLATADHQDQAWQRGRAVFQLSDRNGRAGRQGVTYTAWQLPNSYLGPHKKQPKGRQGQMNRKLADLFMKGITGNGECADQPEDDGQRRFFDSGASATASYNRRPDGDIYWPCRPHSPSSAGVHCQLWHWLPEQGAARRRHNSGRLKAGSAR